MLVVGKHYKWHSVQGVQPPHCQPSCQHIGDVGSPSFRTLQGVRSIRPDRPLLPPVLRSFEGLGMCFVIQLLLIYSSGSHFITKPAQPLFHDALQLAIHPLGSGETFLSLEQALL